ncbi:hypothetical protein [Mesoaciditoga lauensis]|uniref:hypothetical protein n=1 Tax=Mesoaciditoga lauensis TaxID=1495039 RepID=UPI0005691C37|nr:hypothetical protein [Mesoaciditoga lauensis]
MKVIPYQKLLDERLESFQKVLDSQAASLTAERKKLQAMEAKLERLKTTLEASQTKLEAEMKKFNEKLKIEQSYEYRLETLNQWITNSDPVKMGQIIANSKIPLEVLVDALMRLPPKTVGTLLQSIAQTNPSLAASIIYSLAEGKK